MGFRDIIRGVFAAALMTSPPLRFRDFELDPAQFELRRAGHRVRLERKPLELLILLVEKRAPSSLGKRSFSASGVTTFTSTPSAESTMPSARSVLPFMTKAANPTSWKLS
jgi:hypothetical protein